ncbi:helix-turn-helix domain-containing protein [Palleronia abyssalis]
MRHARLDRSANDLRRGESIAQVAWRAGYATVAAFSTAFRARFDG